MTLHSVQIIDSETGEVVRAFAGTILSDAERIERGVNINLAHDRYHTQIVEADDA